MWPLFSLCVVSLIQLRRADGCNTTKPDFSALGGRISEQKCQEYNWERKQLEKCSKDAANTDFPYMGFLGYKKDEKYRFLCGAFLVSPKFVVTQGHCIRVLIPKGLWIPEVVRFGNSNLNDNEPHVDIKITSTTPFFLYRQDSLQYDMALVELESEVPFTKSIYPGCVWSQESLAGVENVFSPGWPKAGSENKNDNIISELKLHVIEQSPCFMRVKDRFRLLNTHICANESITSIPSYEATPTGGSVIVTQFNLDGKAEDRMPFALGVASFGVPAGLGPIPEEFENAGFFLKISDNNFLDWIEQIVWNNDSPNYYEIINSLSW